MEDPRLCLLQLLHVICERYPSTGVRDLDDEPIIFHVSCSCKMSHSVSHFGFLLLDKVEGGVGSANQKVD